MHSHTVRRLLALVRTTIFAIVVMGTVGIYLPYFLGFLGDDMHIADARGIGILPLLLGGYIALRCAFSFAWSGLGTPLPLDPPRHLVVAGLYRHARNPMYTGVVLFLFGEWLLWGTNLRGFAIYLAAVIIAVSGFVVLYEEPTLTRKFGAEYDEYRKNVPRFVPRLEPWAPKSKSAASSQG
ncbi:MAG TPA: isoprenylcysteine carboxylmethyltransferase family protein [Terriglobales bacterium]|nr:isoprenylcysteine carboxylmethyltransferase family protein [Terriglobales bacterium]